MLPINRKLIRSEALWGIKLWIRQGPFKVNNWLDLKMTVRLSISIIKYTKITRFTRHRPRPYSTMGHFHSNFHSSFFIGDWAILFQNSDIWFRRTVHNKNDIFDAKFSTRLPKSRFLIRSLSNFCEPIFTEILQISVKIVKKIVSLLKIDCKRDEVMGHKIMNFWTKNEFQNRLKLKIICSFKMERGVLRWDWM